MSGKKRSRPVRACLIVNARSDGGKFKLSDALTVLTAHGWDVAVREKHEKGEATELAHKAARDGYDPIVSCGGDGTLNEIVDALAGTDVALGAIPGGTVNVWSKEIGISQRTQEAATQLVDSQRARVDVGRVEIDGRHHHSFLMMAGLGADAAVMERVSRSMKNKLGPLAVGVAAVEALPSFHATAIKAELDGERWEGEITELIVGNTRRYGGFTSITPEAYIDDGLFDVCLFTTGGILGTAQQMTSMLLRQHPSATSATLYRASHIVVHASEMLPLQVDGSAVDPDSSEREVEYSFSLLPRGLTVLVPRTYHGALFEHGIPTNGKDGKKKKKEK